MQTTSRGCPYYDSTGDYRADADALEDPSKPFYRAQKSISRLPIPSLEETCERFLPTALPLAETPSQAESLQEAVSKFPDQARELQKRLLQRSQGNPNSSWLQEWWNRLGYLQVRDPVVVFVSYFFWCDDDIQLEALKTANNNLHQTYEPCVARSAAVLPAAIQYALHLRSYQRDPLAIGKHTLCASQSKYMFNASRIPQPNQDLYRLYFPSLQDQQVVIACRGQFFAVAIDQPMSQRQWRHILRHCIQQANTDNNPSPTSTPSMGWLSGLPRDEWALARDTLLKAGGVLMQHALETLESSLFMLCMDIDEEIQTDKDCGVQLWHGGADHRTKDYHNRWYDKSAAVIVTQNGTLGFQGEHSMLDGMPYVDFCDTMVQEGRVEADCFQDTAVLQEEALPRVTNIFQDAFESLPPSSREEIDACLESARNHLVSLTGDYEFQAQHYQTYGSNTIKKAGCSPDAYIQMAMQLASYRMMGEPLATYESTQVMRFLHGRTETTRSVSPASVAFCQSMDRGYEAEGSSADLRNHRYKLLQEACQSHVTYIRSALEGKGVDRHLFGLSMCLDDTLETPDLFSHPLYVKSKRFRISTSSLPNMAVGFGPVVNDGFGIGYEAKPEACYFHVTARKELGWTEPMCKFLAEALNDMRSLYDLEEDPAPRSRL